MHKSDHKILLVCIISTLFIWGWLSQLELKYSSFLLAISQAIMASVAVSILLKLKRGGYIGYIFSFLFGWMASFLSSVFLEAIFYPTGVEAMGDQWSQGVLLMSLSGWFVLSLGYAGAFQATIIYAVAYYYTIPSNKDKSDYGGR